MFIISRGGEPPRGNSNNLWIDHMIPPVRIAAILGAAFTLVLSMHVFADETQCMTGSDCTNPTLGDMNGLPSWASCMGTEPTLPPDPVGTFVSIDGGGGPGVPGGIGAALQLSQAAMACQYPIGSTGPAGGTVCAVGGVTPFGSPSVSTFTGGFYAGESQRYLWHYQTLDGNGACTGQAAGDFGVSEGRSMRCPVGYNNILLSNSSGYICVANRYCEECNKVGNPITVGKSEKTQVETDFIGGGAFPLRIVRYYGHRSEGSSLGEALDAVPTMGRGWRTFYDRGVFVFTAPLATLVTVRRETGGNRMFRMDPSTFALTAQGNELGRLERLTDGTGTLTGWRYTTGDESVEMYDASGKLASITSASGMTHTLAYDASNRIDTVTDPFGRQLKYHYGTDGFVDTITAPGALVYSYAHTSRGALQSVTYPDSTVRQYLYETANQPWSLTGIVDERGIRQSTYAYNTVNYLAQSTQLAGGVYKYTISGATVTDPLGSNYTYTFGLSASAGGYLLAEIDQPRIGGGYTSKVYTYDAHGNVTRYVDDNNNVTTYTFDLTRNLETQRVEGSGSTVARTISTQWHATRRLPKSVAEPLRVTSYAYNGETGVSCAPAGASTALLCSKIIQATTDATGSAGFGATADGTPRTWAYTYDANGQILTVDGPRTDVTDVTTMAYDATGNLSTITNALGHVTQLTNYDAAGRLTRSVDPAGVETLMDYHVRGWLAHRQLGTAASGYETTTYDHDGSGLLTKVAMPDASFVSYTYDDARRLTDIRDGLGNHIQYTLDNMGNRTLEQSFDVNATLVRAHSRVIDALNRVSQDIGGTSPATQITTNAYDANNNVTSVTDPLSRVTTNSYDARNRLKQVIDPLNGSLAPTKYTYNNRDQVTQVTDPQNISTTYTYNGHGEQLTEVSPNTGTTTYTYDPASNVLTKLDARGTLATYTYDALNRVSSITYPDETVTYTYDCAGNTGRLCGISDRSGTTTYTYDAHGHVASKAQTVGTITETVGYTYNAAGQLSTLTLPSGRVVTYGYSNNRPVSVSVDGTLVLDSVFYEPFGPNGGWHWGNSTTLAPNTHTRLFDKDFRPTRITSDLPATAGQPAFDEQITWDIASRVTGITDMSGRVPAATYGYNALDALTSATLGTSSYGYTYSGVGDRLTSTVNGAGSTYTYLTGTHKLTSVTGAAPRSFTFDAMGNVTVDGTKTWTYDGKGRNKQVTIAGVTTQYGINALGQRVMKTDGSGVKTFFAYDEKGHLVGEYDNSGAAIQETVWLGEIPIAVVRPGPTIYYAHPDHLTTPREITQSTDNQIAWRWDNTEPFGNAAPDQNPSGLGTFTFNDRFLGQYFDSEAATTYNYYRDYDQTTGRYLASDPMSLAAGLNSFMYVAGNPLLRTDATGRFFFVPILIGIGVGAGESASIVGSAALIGGAAWWIDHKPKPCEQCSNASGSSNPLPPLDGGPRESHTEVKVPAPVPPAPPQPPGYGCKALFDSCVTGVSRCVSGPTARSALNGVCLALYLMCQAASGLR